MMSEGNKLIYTMGTSTRSPEEFIELVTSHNLEVVVDVRRFPTSRFEHFRREKLAKLLGGIGIDYIYMGQELGGYRKGGYKSFTTTPDFKAGVKELEEISLAQEDLSP